MFKIIFFLMNALDGSRLLNLVNSKWGGALCAIVLGVLLSCALAPFEIWPTAILAYSFLMMLLSVAKCGTWRGIAFFLPKKQQPDGQSRAATEHPAHAPTRQTRRHPRRRCLAAG